MSSNRFLGLVTAALATITVVGCGDNIHPDFGIDVTPTAITTGETGTSATFTVSLRSRPTDNVTIPVQVDDPTEGQVALAELVFTPETADPLVVTVTGLDDSEDDGDVTYHVLLGHAASGDPLYDGTDPADVTVTNTDDDPTLLAGITVTAGVAPATSESGGQATFTVVLASQPTGDVTIALSSTDLTEATVTPATLTFTNANWDMAQTVTATGVDDDIDDGDQPFSIVLAPATSTDPDYDGLDGADVAMTNVDDDGVGILVTPLGGLVTTEAGGFASVQIVLGSEPTADVTIAVSSSDVSEGTVDTASLTFTAVDWDQPRTVTVTGVDDAVDDGDVAYLIVVAAAVSTDPDYSGLDAADAGVTNLDDDAAGVTVTPSSDLVTTEPGGTDSFALVLDSQPTADVTFAITSSDPGEGTVDAASVTFTTADWDQGHVVNVAGVDDLLDDGDQGYTIQLAPAASLDPGYAGLDPADITATNLDDDNAGFLVIPASGLEVSEDLTSDTFTIVLTSQPTDDVTVSLTSNDLTEGTVAPASVTFTNADWDQVQTVTVTGVDDSAHDGPQDVLILTGPAVSLDPTYSGQNPINVGVTNFDNESASVQIIALNPLTTSEDLMRARFRLRLTQPPTATVVCSFTSSDNGEATVAPAVVTFTTANWFTMQVVTVFGTDDRVVDGTQPFTVVSGACTSADLAYDGFDPRDLPGINLDND